MPRRRDPLNARQVEIKKLLYAAKGDISSQDLADRFGVGRTTIWKDRIAIRRRYPPKLDHWDENSERAKALDWFDAMEERLFDELDENERRIVRMTGPAAIGFLNVRVSLLAQIRNLESERRSFLLQVGLFKEAPKELHIESRTLAALSGRDLDDEIAKTRERLARIRGEQPDAGRSTD
jgi:hypothetical protein